MRNLVFRKSSRCHPWDCPDCVEVADLPDGGAAVRDSKDPTGSVLAFGAGQWAAFTTGIRHGGFA